VEREPGGYQGRDDYKKTNIPEAAVQLFKVSDPSFAGPLALLVFL
jgi:hypothetical protein